MLWVDAAGAEEWGEVSENRRRGKRAPFHAWVELSVDGKRRRAEAVDLSTGGLGVCRLGRDIAASGATVLIEFPLPGIHLPLALSSVVSWSDPSGERAGMRFLDADPGLVELVENYLSGRLTD